MEDKKVLKKKILIIGGYGAMGKMIEKFLSINSNYTITLFDKEDWSVKPTLLSEQDLVLISVPIAITSEVIKKTASMINPSTILVDFTSLKQQPLKDMLDHHIGPVLGLHPIFGSSISKPDKQVIVYCDGRQSEEYQWFLNELRFLHFHLEKMTAKEHDDAMTFIQGVEHFSVFCLGQFLKQKNVNINKLLQLASPVYRMELNIVGRLFSQDPELYADIIMADKSRISMIGDFVKSIHNEYDKININDRQAFIDDFSKTSDWMGDFAKQAYKESDQVLKK